ncbi:hypothetical protein JXA32_06795 [Candidatus Sumerlaeota bacterium]|nr:hypothetical protein [Candidatus Sumerlaeota bacterium]
MLFRTTKDNPIAQRELRLARRSPVLMLITLLMALCAFGGIYGFHAHFTDQFNAWKPKQIALYQKTIQGYRRDTKPLNQNQINTLNGIKKELQVLDQKTFGYSGYNRICNYQANLYIMPPRYYIFPMFFDASRFYILGVNLIAIFFFLIFFPLYAAGTLRNRLMSYSLHDLNMSLLTPRELAYGLLQGAWLSWRRGALILIAPNAIWMLYLMIVFLSPQSIFSSLACKVGRNSLLTGLGLDVLRIEIDGTIEGIGALMELARWPLAAWIALAVALRMPNHRFQQFIEVFGFLLLYVFCTLSLSMLLSSFFQTEAGFLLTQTAILGATLALAGMALRRIERFICRYWLDASGELDELDNEERGAMRRYRRI